MNTAEPTETTTWYYEQNGKRIGGISESEIIQLINNRTLSYGSSVWRKGFPDWMNIENTELRSHLENIIPPPLTGQHVNNTIVWILAFAPILGYFLEYIVAEIVYSGKPYLVDIAMTQAKFWYITIILNIGLSILDEIRLEKAGIETKSFKGFVWLVPVYLFQRAKALKQNLAYFFVWIGCLVVVIAGS